MHDDIRSWEAEFRQKFPDFGNAVSFIKRVEEDAGDAAMNKTSPAKEHNTKSSACWCNPRIEPVEGGGNVIVHRDN